MEKVEMNKDMKLSEHFTLGEVTKTSIKTEDGNIPSRVAIENLRNLCENPEVNKRVGGAPTSNHLTGCAVDIHVTGFEQAIRYASILLDISDGTKRDYDELFIEKNSSGSHWIHFAVRPKGNRRKGGFIKV